MHEDIFESIRFFYKKILKMNWNDDDIPHMKRDRSLPTVVSRQEINAIIDATKNLKHKAIIATMYSGRYRSYQHFPYLGQRHELSSPYPCHCSWRRA